MEIIVTEDYQTMSQIAADIVEKQIRENPSSVLGLPTGSTPLGLYKELRTRFNTHPLSYKNVTTINLDEYIGLSRDHPNSYSSFMNENLFKHIDIPIANTYIPNGQADSIEEECHRYERILDEIGPVNLQILGMGTNGHIGFNEPGTDENSSTHCVKLKESTRKNNARFFNSLDEVPTHAITMGIASILKSERILLLASGRKKREAVKTLLNKEVTENFPASHLWKHENVTLIADVEAYGLIAEDGETEINSM